MANVDLKTIDTRNQVLLERIKQGEHLKFEKFLRKIEKGVRKTLSDAGEAIETKKKLNAILAQVNDLQKKIYDDYTGQLILDLGEIGIQQAAFESKSYEVVTVKYESQLPSNSQILTAIRVNPLQVANYAGDPLIEPFIKDFSATQTQRISTVIQQGFYQGQTNNQITRAIRGTAQNKFNDGELAKVNRANRTIVRTAVQHASTQARVESMKKNKDLVKGYEWVSTLDSRTSLTCTSLDGRRFEVGDGPLPPIHPNCRSTITPTLSDSFDFLDAGATRASKGASGGKQVDAKETYYSWLKKQPVAFQNDAIGVTRSRLLRNGGLSSDEFARLSLNKNFQPLTLQELHNKQPSVFESAGVKAP